MKLLIDTNRILELSNKEYNDNDIHDPDYYGGLWAMLQGIASLLQEENPSFDKEKFLQMAEDNESA